MPWIGVSLLLEWGEQVYTQGYASLRSAQITWSAFLKPLSPDTCPKALHTPTLPPTVTQGTVALPQFSEEEAKSTKDQLIRLKVQSSSVTGLDQLWKCRHKIFIFENYSYLTPGHSSAETWIYKFSKYPNHNHWVPTPICHSEYNRFPTPNNKPKNGNHDPFLKNFGHFHMPADLQITPGLGSKILTSSS